MKRWKKILSVALSGVLAVSLLSILGSSEQALADSDLEGYFSDADLTAYGTDGPEPDEVLPDANQYEYQKNELAAFCHFGPNTFNEVEWGDSYGDKDPSEIFTLTEDFDAYGYVKTLKDAGFTKLIVTAKHHDGFCIWASEYTTYDIASTDYKDSEGDILKELSEACTYYDMDMGLYLSPWDIHDPSYGYYDENGNATNAEGDYLDYNEYYNNQLIEILSNEEYGNKGRFVEVWMDGAKGSGANAQDYNFEKWFKTIQTYEGKGAGYEADCLLFGAGAYTTVRWIGNENGYAYKNTWAKSKADYENNEINNNNNGNGYTLGFEDGNKWTVPEADARITSGWFWGTKKNTPKTLSELADMYFGSIGNGAVLLLNVPPNNEGKLDSAIEERVLEFGKAISETFSKNLAAASGATVYASSVWNSDSGYSPANTVDGDDSSYWAAASGSSTGTLIVDLGGYKTFDVVSVEEAIQNGQRINSYKIEYRNGSGEWVELDSGETVGSKRLCRTAAVYGDMVRITVSTTDGKVPMISEVGIYKASEGFELTGGAPDGMVFINDTDNNFVYSDGWTTESGDSYLGGSSTYAYADKSLELSFTGTKVYLLGTCGSQYGTADIYIDGVYVGSIDSSASAASSNEIIFTSEDLANGEHKLKLVVTGGAMIRVEGAWVINNGGLGMVGIEYDAYSMDENETIEVKLLRVGATEDTTVTVTASPNAGSAIQDDFDTEKITTVTFEAGETEKTVEVTTRRNTNTTGNQYFTLELTTTTEGLILGFNQKATITIYDTESMETYIAELLETLAALVEDRESQLEEWYIDGWDNYEAAIEAGSALLEKNTDELTRKELEEAITAIEKALKALVSRPGYSADDPFVLPSVVGDTATMEAEFVTAMYDDTSDGGAYPLKIVSDSSWGSHGGHINNFNVGDTLSYAYYAEAAGIYEVTVQYRSGSTANSFSWHEESGKIEEGSVTAGSNNSSVTQTQTFTIDVTEPGAGVLVLAAGANKGPQLDKFTFTLIKKVDVRKTCYTAEDPFEFPSAEGTSSTMEAEFATSWSDDRSDGMLITRISWANWASRNYVLSAVNAGDTVSFAYNAETAGTYEVTLTYRSDEPANSFRYSEESGKITAGEVTAGAVSASEKYTVTHTVTFTLEVTEAGSGILVLEAGDSNAPQMDTFDVTLLKAE